MSLGFIVLSALGAFVFFHAGAWPVGILFSGLLLVYLAEFAVSVRPKASEVLLGTFRLATGVWLMYLTVSTTLDIAAGFNLPHG
jgi:hypothetical protein